MARALVSRIAKLEKGDRGTNDGGPFYLLWVEPGEDRAMALAAFQTQGKCPADVPIYCAEWKAPERFTRCGRVLEPQPRSRSFAWNFCIIGRFASGRLPEKLAPEYERAPQ